MILIGVYMNLILRRFLFCVLFVTLISALTFADGFTKNEKPTVTYDAFNNALGMFASVIPNGGAYGLHYQHWFNKFGFQITGGGFFDPDNTWGSTLDYSVLLEGLYSVYGNSFSEQIAGRLYTWTALGHHGFKPDNTISRLDNTLKDFVYEEDDSYYPNILAGLGIGIEFILFEHFSFPMQFGYMGEFPFKPGFGFSGGTGIRYRY